MRSMATLVHFAIDGRTLRFPAPFHSMLWRSSSILNLNKSLLKVNL